MESGGSSQRELQKQPHHGIAAAFVAVTYDYHDGKVHAASRPLRCRKTTPRASPELRLGQIRTDTLYRSVLVSALETLWESFFDL